ncbi:hypothetical protein Tdes44962_MAKER00638 [Teratosphaeria destructans]|uniref:Uncharacterized protein n=1 Tax=Teratosphaeria destructans TaxID=418781 RepID=A0A9W7SNG7_9PEZI|nr:hypothetical protein Tdes44962_MAKER00638 [Teratosphaeria destructans]
MVSAASGISSSLSSRRPSVEGLDATAEFLRMRSSPLDELTERISRVAASRQRSVGRSFERPPVTRHRISLLSGDLFRQDTTVVPAAPHSAVAVELSRPSTATVVVNVAPAESTAEDAVPHRSMPAGSPPREITPSSPSTPLDSSTGADARSPLAQKSPSKAVEPSSSAVKRKPLPTESMTPRMPIYDDSKPPGTQPRTPADIPPPARPRPQHADGLAARNPAPVTSPTTAVNPMTMALQVTTAMGTPPSIPERHVHRPAHQGATPRPRRPRAAHASVTSQEENDLDGQMGRHPELEGDRRTWVSRREEGSLESTPPREGRFEQYLS